MKRTRASDSLARVFREVEGLEEDVEVLELDVENLRGRIENSEYTITDIAREIELFREQGIAIQSCTADKLIDKLDDYLDECMTSARWGIEV